MITGGTFTVQWKLKNIYKSLLTIWKKLNFKIQWQLKNVWENSMAIRYLTHTLDYTKGRAYNSRSEPSTVN